RGRRVHQELPAQRCAGTVVALSQCGPPGAIAHVALPHHDGVARSVQGHRRPELLACGRRVDVELGPHGLGPKLETREETEYKEKARVPTESGHDRLLA